MGYRHASSGYSSGNEYVVIFHRCTETELSYCTETELSYCNVRDSNMSAFEWGGLLFSHPLLFCWSVMASGSIFISVLLKRSLERRHPQMDWKQGPLPTLYLPSQTTAHWHGCSTDGRCTTMGSHRFQQGPKHHPMRAEPSQGKLIRVHAACQRAGLLLLHASPIPKYRSLARRAVQPLKALHLSCISLNHITDASSAVARSIEDDSSNAICHPRSRRLGQTSPNCLQDHPQVSLSSFGNFRRTF